MEQDEPAALNRWLIHVLWFVTGVVQTVCVATLLRLASLADGTLGFHGDAASIEPMMWPYLAATAVLSFLLGVVAATLLVGLARQRARKLKCVPPLLLEALLLSAVGLGADANASGLAAWSDWAALAALSMAMGLQSGTSVLVSKAVAGTTNVLTLLTIIAESEVKRTSPRESPKPLPMDRLPLSDLGSLTTMVMFFAAGVVVGCITTFDAHFSALVIAALMLIVAAVASILDELWSSGPQP